MIGTTEIILIVVAVLILFGGKKIPELMRGLGSGVAEFKKGMREGTEDDKTKEEKKN
jgi:sec-independent protein translocase protein TatA